MVKQISTQDFNSSIASGIVVVDFFATRCGPCQMIAPYLEEMDEKTGDQVKFFKVDVDQERGLASEQGIMAMPTLKVYNNGQEVDTVVGADLQKLWKLVQGELEKTAS